MSNSSGSAARKPKLAVERLEDRTVPTFLPRTGLLSPATVDGQPFPPLGQGGLSIAVADIIPEANPLAANAEYVLGTGPGVDGQVLVYDNNGTPLYSFVALPGFKGGINVAVGDVLGDGSPEIVVAGAGGGPPLVAVYTPTGQLLSAFYLAGNTSFTGGLNIAVGNVLGGIGNGGFGGGGNAGFKSEIVIGIASVAPVVFVTDGFGNIQRAFFAFDPNSGVGVTVAASSIDTTRSPGSGGGGGGGFGGPGRLPDTNSYAEIIVGAATRVPAVAVYSVWQSNTPQLRQIYFAFDPSIPANQHGVTVAAGSTDGNRGAEIYVSLVGTSTIRAFGGASGQLLAQVDAFPVTYSGVVNMAIGNVTQFDSTDDSNGNFNGFGNPFFNTQDLAVVAGDGPFRQQPRVFFGRANSAAGRNGP